MNICVFCGASPATHPLHLELASEVGCKLAEYGCTVVTGGGAHGMMGAVTAAASAANGHTIGYLPRFLFDREPPHPLLGDLHVVDTMHERKAAMYAMADAFLVLPGGFGTLDEAIEIVTWRQLSLHEKPAVFVGRDFWAGLRTTFDAMHADGFLSDRDRSLVSFVASADEAVALVGRLKPVASDGPLLASKGLASVGEPGIG